MKIGDLVRMKGDDALGIIMELNTYAESSLGPCWHVFYFDYGMTLSVGEYEMEVVSCVN